MQEDSGCRQFQQLARVSRRQWLSAGAAAGLGIALPDFLRLTDRARGASLRSKSFGSAKKVIFIFLHGGNPQHETWDPKPQSPAEVRGEFGDVQTALPGVRFSELFPRCAKLADRLTIVRSMAHDNTNHVQACLPAMTGHKHPPEVRGRGDFPPSPGNFPHFGAVMDHLRLANAGERRGVSPTWAGDQTQQNPKVDGHSSTLPNWVQIGPVMTRNNGTVLHGQSPGFLGRDHSPLMVDQDLLKEDVRIEAVAPQVGVSRLESRQQLLDDVERQRRALDSAAARTKDAYYRRAYGLLTATATQQAFDLAREPEPIRRMYPQSQVGLSCLLARRLVEAGVPFVNVHWCKTPKGSWDTHSNNFRQMHDSLGPTLDGSLAALVEDLEQRGLLDEVLVVAMAEFGRTPSINRNAGRDHWPFVYSLALAGAGLARGVVEGESDRLGAYPQSTPHDPADMAATIFHLLGVAPDAELYDEQQRPHRLVVGRPIEGILG